MAQTVNRTFTNNYPQEYISQTRFNTEKTLITIAALYQACEANRAHGIVFQNVCLNEYGKLWR